MTSTPAPTGATTAATPAETHTSDVLGIPRHLWSAPVADVRRGTAPRLTRLVWLAPLAALLSAYLGAAAAAHGHVDAGGWLLALAVLVTLAGAAVVAVHAHRAARYRAETPR